MKEEDKNHYLYKKKKKKTQRGKMREEVNKLQYLHQLHQKHMVIECKVAMIKFMIKDKWS